MFALLDYVVKLCTKDLGEITMASPQQGHMGYEMCDFRQITRYISKTVQNRIIVSIKDRKSYHSYAFYRMMKLLVTFSDFNHSQITRFTICVFLYIFSTAEVL